MFDSSMGSLKGETLAESRTYSNERPNVDQQENFLFRDCPSRIALRKSNDYIESEDQI